MHCTVLNISVFNFNGYCVVYCTGYCVFALYGKEIVLDIEYCIVLDIVYSTRQLCSLLYWILVQCNVMDNV